MLVSFFLRPFLKVLMSASMHWLNFKSLLYPVLRFSDRNKLFFQNMILVTSPNFLTTSF
ncbi:hypothetical protein Lalb_Chr15g0076191 [Lupinus albus]|uniref:Uncharacterized protein n=1 Tax=Lupinus albus TaxID=3870 RepID=A0A6A4PD01_LUPAL|nr:hypothetical protein Lalb_Chr15g0076191 [Lupinus albus]